MHPVLTTFEWGGHVLPLASYGLCVALALLLGGVCSLALAVRHGLEAGAMIAASASAVLLGFVGSYLMFAAVSWLHGSPLATALAQPGLVFYGGAAFAFGGFCLAARALSLPAAVALDAAAPVLPLAHALGRVGCFLGGCCYGAPSHGPFAVTYHDLLAPAAHPALPRHPWPLYEALALVAIAVVVTRRPVEPLRPGQRFLAYVVLYALARLVLEPLRGDAVRGVFFGAASTSQLFAGFTLLVALLYPRVRPRCT